MFLRPSAPRPLGLRLSAIADAVPASALADLLYAFTTEERSFQFPPRLHDEMFAIAWSQRPDIWPPSISSRKVAAIDTVLALLSARSPRPRCRARASSAARRSRCCSFYQSLYGHHHGISLRSAFDIMGSRFLDLDHRVRARHILHRGRLQHAVARFRRLSGNLHRRRPWI